MKPFALQSLFQIYGIGSASGLIYHDNKLFIISDNSSYLYEFDITIKELKKIKLFKNSQENILKIDKFDFESIAKKGNKLYLFGSGSTHNRNKRISYNLKNNSLKEKNLSQLYAKLKKHAEISDNDLNIEGAFYSNKSWYFFQRGNVGQSKNGIFIYNKANKQISFTSIILPKIQNIEATFTNAILVENKIYFLAAVENTISTYDDGEILGSYIGCLTLDAFEINFTQLISGINKCEGLSLYKNSNQKLQFLLCEDNDTESLETIVFKLTISFKLFLTKK